MVTTSAGCGSSDSINIPGGNDGPEESLGSALLSVEAPSPPPPPSLPAGRNAGRAMGGGCYRCCRRYCWSRYACINEIWVTMLCLGALSIATFLLLEMFACDIVESPPLTSRVDDNRGGWVDAVTSTATVKQSCCPWLPRTCCSVFGTCLEQLFVAGLSLLFGVLLAFFHACCGCGCMMRRCCQSPGGCRFSQAYPVAVVIRDCILTQSYEHLFILGYRAISAYLCLRMLCPKKTYLLYVYG